MKAIAPLLTGSKDVSPQGATLLITPGVQLSVTLWLKTGMHLHTPSELCLPIARPCHGREHCAKPRRDSPALAYPPQWYKFQHSLTASGSRKRSGHDDSDDGLFGPDPVPEPTSWSAAAYNYDVLPTKRRDCKYREWVQGTEEYNERAVQAIMYDRDLVAWAMGMARERWEMPFWAVQVLGLIGGQAQQ